MPQLAQQRAEHDTGTNLVLIRGLEEIMNVTNDQVPLVEKSHEFELAEVAIHDIHFIMKTDSPAYSRQWKIAQPYCRCYRAERGVGEDTPDGEVDYQVLYGKVPSN